MHYRDSSSTRMISATTDSTSRQSTSTAMRSQDFLRSMPVTSIIGMRPGLYAGPFVFADETRHGRGRARTLMDGFSSV